MHRSQIHLVLLTFFFFSVSRLISQPTNFVSLIAQPGAACSVIIQWTYDPSADSLGFEIERSRDKLAWEKIGTVSPSASHQYYMIDNNPRDSLSYYRVRQIDRQ